MQSGWGRETASNAVCLGQRPRMSNGTVASMYGASKVQWPRTVNVLVSYSRLQRAGFVARAGSVLRARVAVSTTPVASRPCIEPREPRSWAAVTPLQSVSSKLIRRRTAQGQRFVPDLGSHPRASASGVRLGHRVRHALSSRQTAKIYTRKFCIGANRADFEWGVFLMSQWRTSTVTRSTSRLRIWWLGSDCASLPGFTVSIGVPVVG